jgi:uncharacterized membrane protein YsdA (DUF1294 family)
MNQARPRLMRIPKGTDLVINKVSGAPGIWIGQCHSHGRRADHHAGDAR